MNNSTTTTTNATHDAPVQVMCRFERAELDALRRATGANADATAVACYVRRNLSADAEGAK